MSNYAIISIPVYFALVMWPNFVAFGLLSASKKFDNVNPRGTNNDTARKVLSAADFGKWERARAAHANGWESFPFFAIAMVAGQSTGVAPSTLNFAAVGALVLRVAYTLSYLHITSKRLSNLRTAVWVSGTLLSLNVLRLAGMKTL